MRDIHTTINTLLLAFAKLVKSLGGSRIRGMSKIKFIHSYHFIISLDNLLEAWREFLKGKRSRKDVQEFELNLMANILDLHRELRDKTYCHSDYHAFNISDPKPRNIHKASVRDRLLHHALYRQLYPFFDRTFIYDSYSCRMDKGTHNAINQFRAFGYKVSQNHTKTVWILKCDIKKFFASVDHSVLKKIISNYIPDQDIKWLLWQVIDSFSVNKGRGLPLGNLTSQLFVNVYMNEFDQFMKHKLKARYYIRYADDFAIFSDDKRYLKKMLSRIDLFLREKLKLYLHPNKVSIETVGSGVDFLGWVHFSDHRVLRTVSKRRMFRTIQVKQGNNETVQSYLGLLRHGNSHSLLSEIAELVSKYDKDDVLD